MGKVRPQLIKRMALKIYKEKPEIFTTSFEDNKRILNETLDIKSKKIRNRIAGYITRLKKRELAGTLFK